METEYEILKRENMKLKAENDQLKQHMYLPKIVNNVFDYFMWVNKNISSTIEQFGEKK